MSSKIQQTDAQAFWHYGLTSYHCLEKPQGHTILRAKKIVGSKTRLPSSYTCPPVRPSEAELATGAEASGTVAVLWVGIRIETAQDYRLKKPIGTKKATTRAKSVNGAIASGIVDNIPTDHRALRVVVDLTRTSEQLNVFVLINPDENGICEAYSTEIEEVWWAPLYRDDEVENVSMRRKLWRAKLKSEVDQLIYKSQESTARPSRYEETLAQDSVTTKALRVRRLLQEYRVNRKIEPLKDVLLALGALETYEKARPYRRELTSIDKFFSTEMTLARSDVTLAFDAILALYPDINKHHGLLREEKLIFLADTMRRTKTSVHWVHRRHVIIDWARKMERYSWQNGTPEAEAGQLDYDLKETLATASLYCADPQKKFEEDIRDDAETDNFMKTFMKHHIQVLKCLHNEQRAGTEKLRTVAGPPMTTLDLKAIMERLVNTVDRDEVFLWANESLNFLMHSVLQSYRRDDSVLAKYIADCEELIHGWVEIDEGSSIDEDENDNSGRMDLSH